MVELFLSSRDSYQESALSQKINNPSLIVKWINDFRVLGSDALRSKKKGRKKTLVIKKFKKSSKAIEEKPADTNAERVKELEDDVLKIRIENALFKRIEEAVFRGGNFSEKTVRIIHSLRGQFKLKDILAVISLPKSTYVY